MRVVCGKWHDKLQNKYNEIISKNLFGYITTFGVGSDAGSEVDNIIKCHVFSRIIYLGTKLYAFLEFRFIITCKSTYGYKSLFKHSYHLCIHPLV